MKNKNTIGPSIHKVEPFFISKFYQNSNKSILYIGKDEREISQIMKYEDQEEAETINTELDRIKSLANLS